MRSVLFPIMLLGSTLVATSGHAGDGKAVYEKKCAACHSAMSPKLKGDKVAWDARLKQGVDGLVASVLKGKGVMPPNGGDSKLSETEIRDAVEYMVSAIK